MIWATFGRLPNLSAPENSRQAPVPWPPLITSNPDQQPSQRFFIRRTRHPALRDNRGHVFCRRDIERRVFHLHPVWRELPSPHVRHFLWMALLNRNAAAVG